MDILKEKLIKIWSRDTPICENVLGSGTPTPPGVEVWRTKIRFYCAGYRKPATTTTIQICRFITLRGKIKGLNNNKDSRLTVGHFWSWANSGGSTIIIIVVLIDFAELQLCQTVHLESSLFFKPLIFPRKVMTRHPVLLLFFHFSYALEGRI